MSYDRVYVVNITEAICFGDQEKDSNNISSYLNPKNKYTKYKYFYILTYKILNAFISQINSSYILLTLFPSIVSDCQHHRSLNDSINWLRLSFMSEWKFPLWEYEMYIPSGWNTIRHAIITLWHLCHNYIGDMLTLL